MLRVEEIFVRSIMTGKNRQFSNYHLDREPPGFQIMCYFGSTLMYVPSPQHRLEHVYEFQSLIIRFEMRIQFPFDKLHIHDIHTIEMSSMEGARKTTRSVYRTSLSRLSRCYSFACIADKSRPRNLITTQHSWNLLSLVAILVIVVVGECTPLERHFRSALGFC